MLDEFWAVIPARSGSLKLKNKNIKKLNKKPLIHYSQEIARKTKQIKKIIFTSDSDNYIKISKEKYPADIYHKRSKKISGRNAKDISFFKSIIKFLENNAYELPKYFVHLRPTCPFRDENIISNAIKIFKKKESYSALRSVTQSSETAFKSFIIKHNKLAQIFTNSYDLDKSNLPRHMYPQSYEPNSYVDIIRTSNIKNGYLHGKKVLPFIINQNVIDINTMDDFENAEIFLKKLKA